MLGSVPNSADMLGRYLLNSVKAGQCAEFSENAGQIPAEFSERWADVC